jgi:DNA-binding transcriptional LysR family regulator
MPSNLLGSMRVFAAVVEADSFTLAADKMELSRGMVTRYVAELERHLGVRLLNRTTRTLSLTAAGSDYYQRASQILAMVEEAAASAAQESAVPRGTLRVTASTALSNQHLYRVVSDYVQRYPDVSVELAASERMVDLVEEGFDVAVRVSGEIDPGLVARRLLPVRLAACAAPTYLRKHGVPKSPENLTGHNCLVYSYYSNEWRFMRKGVERTVRVSGNLRSNSSEALRNAAVEGLGVIYEPELLVGEQLKQKHLVRVLPDWESDEFTMFAVYPSRKFLPPKVRSFVDFLAERFSPARKPGLGH